MSDLGPDETTCPFCAETIKRAAVKCRWCGSDLDGATRAPSTEISPPGVERQQTRAERRAARKAERHAAATAAPADEPDHGRAARPRVLPLLLILLLAAGAAVVFAVTRANAEETAPDGTITSDSARAVAMQRAAESTETILSYQAETFDADTEKSRKLMTEKMREDYVEAVEPVKAKVVKEGITLKATVVATSLTEHTEDTVRALVFVNQSTTATGAKNEQLDNNRVVVTMKRDDDDTWLVSQMDPF